MAGISWNLSGLTCSPDRAEMQHLASPLNGSNEY